MVVMRLATAAVVASVVSAVLVLGCSDDAGPGSEPPETVPDVPDKELPGGITAEMCGVGFVHDGDNACEPILPAEPCAAGWMAVPGDSECREIASCGTGKWGDIDLDATAQYVDGAHVGMSDGTAAAPWKTIVEAIAAVPPGGLVAVAAGSYTEDLAISGKAVRLHGVCPQQVEVVATGTAIAAIDITGGASGTELRGLAVRGDAIGVLLSGSEDVLLEQVWVHHTARGLDVESALGATSCTVRASLFENNELTGVFVAAAVVDIEACVVRDTILTDQEGARGIAAQADAFSGEPSLVNVTTSLIERNHEAGIYASGSQINLTSVVVRDTESNAAGLGGVGIDIQASLATGQLSVGTVRTSLIARNREVGIFVSGSEATVEATVVRDTVANANGQFGRGIGVQSRSAASGPSSATLRSLVVAGNLGFGVFVVNSHAAVEGCLVSDTRTNNSGLYGDGILVQHSSGDATTSIEATLIEDSARAGLANFGGFVSVGNSALRCNEIDLDGELFSGNDFQFEDRGGNACGCPTPDGDCAAVSAALLPPEPVE